MTFNNKKFNSVEEMPNWQYPCYLLPTEEEKGITWKQAEEGTEGAIYFYENPLTKLPRFVMWENSERRGQKFYSLHELLQKFQVRAALEVHHLEFTKKIQSTWYGDQDHLIEFVLKTESQWGDSPWVTIQGRLCIHQSVSGALSLLHTCYVEEEEEVNLLPLEEQHLVLFYGYKNEEYDHVLTEQEVVLEMSTLLEILKDALMRSFLECKI